MLKLRNRRRLRQKELEPIIESMMAQTGFSPFAEGDPVEAGDVAGVEVFVARGRVEAILQGATPFPALRALMRTAPERRYVEVDAGAVKFVTNGADVMAPGIVNADPAIRPGDLVWIRDSTHKRPLAVGRALLPGDELATGKSAARKGKAVENLHFVGDKLWELEA